MEPNIATEQDEPGVKPAAFDDSDDERRANVLATTTEAGLDTTSTSDASVLQPHPAIDSETRPSRRATTANGTSDTIEPQDDATVDSASYSTRTRTRGARPNYAEDHDNMEFEYAPTASKRTAAANAALSNGSNGTSAHDGQSKDSAVTTSAGKKRRSIANATRSNESTPGAASAPAKDSTAITTRRNTTHNAASSINRQATSVMTFERTKAIVNREGKLVADDGTTVAVDDHVYLVCEPPGDPYYLCRVMELIYATSNDPTTHVEAVRVNWYYRPRDVQRVSTDTRLVYGTMHSDTCPLTSLRGKCQILHRSHIKDLDEYRKGKDCFWFSQIFDRFIRRFYEVIPCSQIINVPEKVKKALDERWKYVAVESTKVKELTSAIKTCKRCAAYCANHDSVACALCQNSYHMSCVKPPLPKKPSRGFGWSCGPCSRAQEKKLEARHAPQIGSAMEVDEELVEEEEDDPARADSTRAPSPDADSLNDQHPATQAEIDLAKMWPMRYLGIHCRVEDALQYDDCAIYPRASSRLGPRHQAAVNVWHGHHVELVKPADIKKKYVQNKSHKKDAKLSKETLEAISKDREERAKRPKWVLDEPTGYVARGEDYDNDDPRNTAQLLFKMPEHTQRPDVTQKSVASYMKDARALAKPLRIARFNTNLQDKALELLTKHKYDREKALAELTLVDRAKDLKEPVFTKKELADFTEGVRKYGSEHRSIKLHMGTEKPVSMIVRFYYLWKKTPRGKKVWGNYDGRKGTKKQIDPSSAAAAHAEVADPADDSGFDHRKAASHQRTFECKFCATHKSPCWRRAPGVAPGQTSNEDATDVQEDGEPLGPTQYSKEYPLLALCLRCAGLWRRYAIKWEGVDEVARIIQQNSTKGYKRRIDEELIREYEASSAEGPEIVDEGPRKKAKIIVEPKKATPVPVRAPTPPIQPDTPKRRTHPCAVCDNRGSIKEQPITCSHCFLAVHSRCYGIAEGVDPTKWVCDQCTNDKAPAVSTDNSCLLCPWEYTQIDMWKQPKVSHKKKTDRDREKDRLEKLLLEKAKSDLYARQIELSRSPYPREPLKKTDGNHWIHVSCAVWTPELKFSNATTMERVEGFGAIPASRYESRCKLCKAQGKGACVSCQQCHASFHVTCAWAAGYHFGFDVTPVKSSRKDQITTVNLPEESGTMTAAIWCRDHVVKTMIHPMHEIVDETGRTALQLYVENFKQADTNLTGAARKANILHQSIKQPLQSNPHGTTSRRVSVIGQEVLKANKKARAMAGAKDDASPKDSPTAESAPPLPVPELTCIKCGSHTSPKFHDMTRRDVEMAQGIKEEIDSRSSFECHRCHLGYLLPAENARGTSPEESVNRPIWPPPMGDFPAIPKLRFDDEEPELDEGIDNLARVPDNRVNAQSHSHGHSHGQSHGHAHSHSHGSERERRPSLHQHSSNSGKHGHLPSSHAQKSKANGLPAHSHYSQPYVGLPPPVTSNTMRSGFRSPANGAPDRLDYQHEYAARSPPSAHEWGRSSLPPLSSLASPPSEYPDRYQNGHSQNHSHSRERSATVSRPVSGLSNGFGYDPALHGHGSSKASGNNYGRSSTPQDPSIDPRLGGGASASPHLGNLLS